MQVVYEGATLASYHIYMAAFNPWDKVEETGKGLEPFSQITQGPKESFTDFLQRLTSAVGRRVSDLQAIKALVESLTFENDNAEFNFPSCS